MLPDARLAYEAIMEDLSSLHIKWHGRRPSFPKNGRLVISVGLESQSFGIIKKYHDDMIKNLPDAAQFITSQTLDQRYVLTINLEEALRQGIGAAQAA